MITKDYLFVPTKYNMKEELEISTQDEHRQALRWLNVSGD